MVCNTGFRVKASARKTRRDLEVLCERYNATWRRNVQRACCLKRRSCIARGWDRRWVFFCVSKQAGSWYKVEDSKMGSPIFVHGLSWRHKEKFPGTSIILAGDTNRVPQLDRLDGAAEATGV